MKRKIKYKGYVVSQDSNNHVAIYKDGKLMLHGIVNKKLTDDELKKQVDFYLFICFGFDDESEVTMLIKLKDSVDLKELEKFGFKEHNDCYSRDYHNGYLTRIDKKTREILKVDYEWSFLQNKYYKNSTYKINDLIKADLVEKI